MKYGEYFTETISISKDNRASRKIFKINLKYVYFYHLSFTKHFFSPKNTTKCSHVGHCGTNFSKTVMLFPAVRGSEADTGGKQREEVCVGGVRVLQECQHVVPHSCSTFSKPANARRHSPHRQTPVSMSVPPLNDRYRV